MFRVGYRRIGAQIGARKKQNWPITGLRGSLSPQAALARWAAPQRAASRCSGPGVELGGTTRRPSWPPVQRRPGHTGRALYRPACPGREPGRADLALPAAGRPGTARQAPAGGEIGAGRRLGEGQGAGPTKKKPERGPATWDRGCLISRAMFRIFFYK